MTKKFRTVLGDAHRALVPNAWSTRSFAQEGEDLVLARHFGNKRDGFYVDVGSHHPWRFSNTYLFYRRGWSGLCIDPLPGTMRQFQRHRPRDIALEIGISAEPSTLRYFMFNEPALNTFDPALASDRDRQAGYAVREIRDVQTQPLRTVLARHLPKDRVAIDLLSIDVEGLDLEVLKSNDWDRWRPQTVVVECLGATVDALLEDDTYRYLEALGYTAHAKTGQSVIFVDR